MKLTGFHLEGYGSAAKPRQFRLSEGLNVVVDPNADGNILGRLLGGILYGIKGNANSGTTTGDATGEIEVLSNGQSYRASRRFHDHRNSLAIMPVTSMAAPRSMESLCPIDQQTFRTFFCCDIAGRNALTSMAQWLLRDSANGDARIPRESARQLDTLADLSQQIEECNARIRSACARRDLLDRQIMEWERDRSGPRPTPLPAFQASKFETVALLYERLDEIDCQWQAWREVQQEIQKRRVGIRDELANGARGAVNPPDSIPEQCDEFIEALENKIAQIEVGLKTQESDVPSIEKLSAQWCRDVRNCLQSLTLWSERQNGQMRRRTAAAALKQLRNCYNDLENGVKHLLRRRHSILEQIHALDPEGAELIFQGHSQFGSLAQREGYWQARQRCARPIQVHGAPDDSDIQFDRWQLESAKQQRVEIHKQIASEESKLRLLVKQWDLGKSPAGATEQVLETASQFLQQLTNGQWTRLVLSARHSAFVLTNAQGQSTELARLDQTTQCQSAICLSLSVAKAFAQRGIDFPVFICEPQALIGTIGLRRLIELTGDCLARGQQLMVVVRLANDAAAFAPLRPRIVDLTGRQAIHLPEIPALTMDDSHTFRESKSTQKQPTFVPREIDDSETISASEPIYQFPLQRPMAWPSQIESAKVVRSSGAPGFGLGAYAETQNLSRDSEVRDTGVCTFSECAALERIGIATIGNLLDASPNSLAEALSESPDLPSQINQWQACCKMLVCVPELSAEDARILYECGISSPQQLEEMRGELLLSKLQNRLKASGRESSFARYNVDRINRWMRSLARTKPTWKQLESQPQYVKPVELVAPVSPASRPLKLSSPAMELASRRNQEPTSPSVTEPQAPVENAREVLRYHLHLNDSVDAAPSISTRVCEQLGQLGIRTVRDFLNRSADDVAAKIENRRISAETLRLWQKQARLACSVPNLRRHDVQILVACDVCEPEQLASMAPAPLLEKVDEFAKSKAGMRLIRSGKKPDLAEVTSWIRWARHTRSVQAA